MPDLLDGYSLSHILAHGEWDEDDALPDGRFAPLVCGVILLILSVVGWAVVTSVASLFG